MSADKILSGYKEISRFLGISTRSLKRYICKIPITKLGSRVIILESDLIGWVKKQAVQLNLNAKTPPSHPARKS